MFALFNSKIKFWKQIYVGVNTKVKEKKNSLYGQIKIKETASEVRGGLAAKKEFIII